VYGIVERYEEFLRELREEINSTDERISPTSKFDSTFRSRYTIEGEIYEGYTVPETRPPPPISQRVSLERNNIHQER